MKKRIKSVVNLVIASLIIALSYNLFVIPNNIIAPGINGLGALVHYTTNFSEATFILIVNLSLLLITIVTFGFEKSYKYIGACILIPFFIYLTEDVTNLIAINNMEKLLSVLCASILMGLGNSIIYKEGYSVGGFFIIEDIINSIATKNVEVLV